MTLIVGSLQGRTEEVVRGLSPIDLAAYLRTTGWREERREQDSYALWTLSANDQDADDYFEILLPLRPEYRDFVPRMRELMDTLEVAEQRSYLEILDDLSTSNADVVRVRILGNEATDGSISLETNVLLAQRVRDLMLAAACAAVAPRAVYPTRKPDKALQYLKDVRTGQTERGSYVVTVLSPVTPSLEADFNSSFPSLKQEEPFERQVVRQLLLGLEAVRGAAEMSGASGVWAPFQDGIEQGVNGNLCEAVADLAEAGGNVGVDIGCSWSRSRNPPLDTPKRVYIGHGTVPFMRAAAQGFRDKSLRDEDAEVRGFIQIANKRKDAASGLVVIIGKVNGQDRRIETRLSGDVYKAAVRAHERENQIIVYGRVVREGRGYTLKNPHDFQTE